MYRKIVWCYLIVLTLLDISLNTKLSAQGKSNGNGVSVHESLIDGISLQSVPLQEWGGGALVLRPPALAFGRAALAAAHARTVTLTNAGNDTVHLASVAGTSPHFHASFFDSKTLVSGANTSFSVVYLGRREGPVATHLFIHTSKGVIKYPVSAEGSASPWRVWPLVGVRVPLNASLEPLLTLYNPTAVPVLVREVYSSGAWLGLRLPAGGQSAPRDRWLVPPHAARDLVRLSVRPPAPLHAPRTAYIRIKGDMEGGPLVVAVEASAAPRGEYLLPPQLRLRPRGDLDPPDTFELEAGNSDETAVRLEAEVWGASCGPAPPSSRPPPAAPPARHNGRSDGAHVTLLREELAPHEPPAPAARLTLDYGALRAGAGGAGGAGGAWCAGWVRVGRAAAPYSVRLLPGRLRLDPDVIHVVTSRGAEAFVEREVRVQNEFSQPVLVRHVHFPPEVMELFHTESLAPLSLGAGDNGTVARVRLRAGAARAELSARLTLATDLSDYALPLLLYDGKLHFEWEWEESQPRLQLGAMCASWTRRVRARLHNRGPAPLCVTELRADLPGATFELAAPDKRCVDGGAWAAAVLTVVAPARAGAVSGAVTAVTSQAGAVTAVTSQAGAVTAVTSQAGAVTAVTSQAGAVTAVTSQTHEVSLHVLEGRLSARPLLLVGAAPYVWARAPLVLESSVPLSMLVTDVTQASPRDPALRYMPATGDGPAAGEVVYAAEAACAADCATGLDVERGEGAAWLARGALPANEALAADRALLTARRARLPRGDLDLDLLVHTTRVRALPAEARVTWAWPALAVTAPAAPAPRAPVGGAARLAVRLRNPAERPLLLQAVLAPDPRSAFSVVSAEARLYVSLAPLTELEVTVTFAPLTAGEHSALLYIRNNLTILESIPLIGHGVHPSFELDGRPANSSADITLEVTECGPVRRTLLVRNTGDVRVRMREWRLAGAPCLARGFRLTPCAALALAPNETRAITLAYTPDWTRARAGAALTVRAAGAPAAWRLAAAAPAALVTRCAARAPRPPFEPALRALGDALALLALAVAVALAALDAERALRRHRAARDTPPVARAPLDLRALAAPESAPEPEPEPAVAARRRRTPRRRGAALDAAAERRAFERWRAEVSRRPCESAPTAAPSSSSSSSPSPSPPPARERAAPPSSDSAGSERSEPEGESPARAPPPADRSTSDSPAPDAPPRDSHSPPSHAHARESTSRRERSSLRASRSVGAEGGGRARAGARRLAAGARRRRAPSPGAPRTEPPRGPAPPPALRWGASWSSVVSRGAAPDAPPSPRAAAAPPPLAPIGSDVRRRCGSHSLFYYGSAEAPPPPRAAAAPAPPAGYRSLESVWGASMEPHPAAAVWLWGSVRPPPGFAPRSYDPFHSLASIWTPAALDWRRPERAGDTETDGRAANDDSGPGLGRGGAVGGHCNK